MHRELECRLTLSHFCGYECWWQASLPKAESQAQYSGKGAGSSPAVDGEGRRRRGGARTPRRPGRLRLWQWDAWVMALGSAAVPLFDLGYCFPFQSLSFFTCPMGMNLPQRGKADKL